MWFSLFAIALHLLSFPGFGEIVVSTFNETVQPSLIATQFPTLLKIGPPFISPDEEEYDLSLWFHLHAQS